MKYEILTDNEIRIEAVSRSQLPVANSQVQNDSMIHLS